MQISHYNIQTHMHIRPYKVNSWFLSLAHIIFISYFDKGRHHCYTIVLMYHNAFKVTEVMIFTGTCS